MLGNFSFIFFDKIIESLKISVETTERPIANVLEVTLLFLIKDIEGKD